MCKHWSPDDDGTRLIAYTVCATHLHVWKHLVVLARDELHARDLFTAYLASPAQQAEEEEQCRDPRRRDEYRFRFHVGLITGRCADLQLWDGTPSTKVQVFDHGCHG
jgi:hypothetical protein